MYTILLKPVVSFLRRIGFRLLIYLDDLILMNQHAETLIMERNTCLWLLTHLGMLINWEKSISEPCQNLDDLGFVVDSLRLTLSLPPEKVLCGDSTRTSEVSKISVGRLSVPVQQPAVRAGVGTEVVCKTVEASIVSFLRRLGFRLLIYLDDLILMNQHAETLIMERNTCLWLLTHLGMLINWEKSILEPCKNMDDLGFVVDSLHLTLSLPTEKVAKIKTACQILLKKEDTVVVRDLVKLIGQMTASLLAVLPAPLHYQHLQMLRTKGLLKHQNYEACVQLDQTCRNELRWWLHHLELWNGKTFITPSPDMAIQSDSSKVAWGAVCGSVKTQGMWSATESALYINVLELQAANFAVQSSTKGKNNIHVHLQLDNTTAVAYLNNMGGTRSKQLVHVTQDIFQYVLSRQITITAEHLPRVQNVEADYESRVCQDWSNWQLQPKMFQVLNRKWGTFVVDLFADRLNAQIPIFYSWKPDPTVAAIDAFQQPWTEVQGYAFPPCALIGSCLEKVMKDQAVLVLVTTTWQTQAWYPRLLAMAVDYPVLLPPQKDLLLSPRQECHPLVLDGNLQLAAWKVSGIEQQQKAFQDMLPLWLLDPGMKKSKGLIIAPDINGVAGVVGTKLIRFKPL